MVPFPPVEQILCGVKALVCCWTRPPQRDCFVLLIKKSQCYINSGWSVTWIVSRASSFLAVCTDCTDIWSLVFTFGVQQVYLLWTRFHVSVCWASKLKKNSSCIKLARLRASLSANSTQLNMFLSELVWLLSRVHLIALVQLLLKQFVFINSPRGGGRRL